MNLALVGLNHRTAPIHIREQVAFPEEGLAEALRALKNDVQLSEAMIVSTCNRVEIYGGSLNSTTSFSEMKEFLCTYHRLGISNLEEHLYSYRDDELVHHVFRVASSLDSMVPGEAQILGQLKQAFLQARDVGTVGSLLSRLMNHAFFVAKRVRNETKIASSAVSVSSVAVELARKIFGDLDGQTLLLLGAGKMSELAAQSLLRSGAGKIQVSNRTLEKAANVAAKFGGSVIPFAELDDALALSDIVIVSTGARSFVLNSDQMERTIRKRKYTPLFVVDISVPRNVDPRVNEIDNIFLYDIDDLQSVVETNLEGRAREAELAEDIVAQEVYSFSEIEKRQNIGPVFSSLRQKLEDICLEELLKERNGFSEKEYERVQRIMLRAAHRIAHPLMSQMKQPQENPTQQHHYLESIRKAFELKDKE